MSDLALTLPAGSGYVEVALPIPLRRTFTYRMPPELSSQIDVGSRVLVPFGRRELTGFVTEMLVSLPPDSDVRDEKIKSVIEVLDPSPLLTREIVDLARWTADYYLSFIGEILKASLPAGMGRAGRRSYTITDRGRERLSGMLLPRNEQERLLARLREAGPSDAKELEKTFDPTSSKILSALLADDLVSVSRSSQAGPKPKRRKVVRLTGSTPSNGGDRLNPGQMRVLSALDDAGGELPYTELLEKAGVGASPISTLVKYGRVEVSVEETMRDPFGEDNIPKASDIELTSEQAEVYVEIDAALTAGGYAGFLLHGVTGSGKTEVYIQAMRRVLDLGRSGLMLVPEIALTPHLSRRLREHFGRDVAILHSSLSAGERYDEWRRIQRGEARLAIGTRLAVFAPLRDIGLVIVDEEHDTSYRQNESPFYHARDVAVMRASLAGAVVLLGSATPALETYFNAKKGKYKYLRLARRFAERRMANAEIIDMRQVFRSAGKDVVFSPQLLKAIEETAERGEQSIILLNRRGFSQFVLCRTCGETMKCVNCDITLTYHKGRRNLVCHYCNYAVEPPDRCPVCTSEYLYFIGEGTEKLEDQLARRFPKMTIARIDRDTIARRRDMERILTAFRRGEIDMLVGTQMIAKGHDFPKVTLVGVISVDLGLGLPDFRSAERTFQLLTQVAGRAGRGDLAGRVLIQTYYPSHYVLRHAGNQDYEGFYTDEIKFRERMSYPPFFSLASILVRHSDAAMAAASAQKIRKALDNSNVSKACRILGPAPASLSRLKGEYRFQILIKSQSKRRLRETIDLALSDAESEGCDMRLVHTEIDPVNLM